MGLFDFLFGGDQPDPELQPEQEQLFRYLMELARKSERQADTYRNSVPGSLPSEQAALQQALALIGQQGLANRQRSAAQGGVGGLGTLMPGAITDRKTSLQNGLRQARGSTTAQLFSQFAQSRQLASSGAPGIAASAGSALNYFTPQRQPGILPGLAQTYFAAQSGGLLGRPSSAPAAGPLLPGATQGPVFPQNPAFPALPPGGGGMAPGQISQQSTTTSPLPGIPPETLAQLAKVLAASRPGTY